MKAQQVLEALEVSCRNFLARCPWGSNNMLWAVAPIYRVRVFLRGCM